MSFIESHEDVMKLLEETTQYVIKNVKEKFGKEIKQVFGIDVVVPKLPFPRLTMKETLELLKAKGYRSAKGDIDAEGEKLICEVVKKKFGHDFVFVTDYPISVRPFYHMRYPDDKTLTKSFDILWNGMEIATGAQREHRYDVLKQQAVENKLDLKIIEDYLNFFKYGCPPHGGFGLGHARFLELLLGLSNIREATLLSRDTQRLRP
jgi:aspartyl-tRNA synthetase